MGYLLNKIVKICEHKKIFKRNKKGVETKILVETFRIVGC